jgi:hypothetical protein
MAELPFLIQSRLQVFEILLELYLDVLSEFVIGLEPSLQVGLRQTGVSVVPVYFGGVVVSTEPKVKYLFNSLVELNSPCELAIYLIKIIFLTRWFSTTDGSH